jgi:hypothetical protein
MKLIRSDQISQIKTKLDDLIKLKGVWEALDGPIIGGALTISVNAIEKKGIIPDEVCMSVQNAVDLLLGGVYVEALGALEPIADKYINFKKLDDETEAALMGVVFFLLKAVAGYFIAKDK